MYKLFSLVILNLVFISNLYSQSNANSLKNSHSISNVHNNIHIHRNQGPINNFYILFIIIKTGSFNCISNYIANTRFKNDIKIRSITIDTLRIKNNQTLDSYESIIKNKLINENYNFIVIMDEFKILSSDFYKFVNNEYANNNVVVSYSSGADIYLSLTFDRFFTFIHELFNIQEVNVHYLFNANTPMNDVYINLLDNDYGMKIKVIKHQILYRKELNLLLNELSRDKNSVIISNLDYLLDEVSGKLLIMSDISEDLEYYNKNNIFLTITHNVCKKTKTAFSLSWDVNYMGMVLDNFISNKQQHIPIVKQIIPSSFSINFALSTDILKKYDVHKLENLLEYTDNVINN